MKTVNLLKRTCTLSLGAALILSSLSSCKKVDVPSGEPSTKSAVLELDIFSTAPSTKAVNDIAASDDEKAINTLDIMVFNKLGTDSYELEFSSHDSFSPARSSASKKIVTNPGTKVVFVFANMPQKRMQDLLTYDGCLYRVHYFEDNTRGSLVMSAKSAEITIDPDVATMDGTTIDATVDLTLKRDVSRVSVKRVVNAIEPEGIRQIKLSGIYLNNVAKAYDPTESDLDAQEFFIQGGLDITTDIEDMMCNTSTSSSISTPFNLAPAPHVWTSSDYHIYGLTNTCTTTSATDNDNFTKVIIELTETIDSVTNTYYYPIAIKGMAANCSYEIESVTISRLGSHDPQIYVKNAVTSASITVLNWDGTEVAGNPTFNFDSTNGTATF